MAAIVHSTVVVRKRGLIIIYREIIFVESGSKNNQVEVFDFHLSILISLER